jgi:cellobiose epimerase
MKKLREELSQYTRIFREELHNNILAYWIKYAVEKEGDGFYGAVDLLGNPVPEAPKSCVLNARILWTFAAAAKESGNPQYGIIADRAFNVLNRYFADAQHGGYFMTISAGNQPLDDIKHTYAQAFVLYALSKYYEFRPSVELMDQITTYFNFLEAKTKDPLHIGYFEAFTRNWQIYSTNRMADNNEPRSMNTHLHILEAYAAFYNICKDSLVAQRLRELLELFTDRILRYDGHLGIFFDEAFSEAEASKGTCSFGHDIEASWLLWEAAEILNDKNIIEKMRPLSVRMLEAVDRVGIDKDGGLFLESTRYGSHLRTNKHWWPQAETLVALMNGFQLTGDPKYWEKLKLSWNFIDQHVIDHEHGEWFTKVSRLGVPYLTEPEDDPSPYYRNDWKIDPWKCPYHNGRAMMELISRIRKVNDAIKN